MPKIGLMKYLLLILFIPLSYAGSPPECKELAGILDGFETQLESKFISDCGKVDYLEFTKGTPVKDPEFLKEKMCSDLATIEAQLEKLKIEHGVLTGIEELKTSVAVSKEEASSPNPKAARVAGMSFVSSLNTAQTLEVLLNAPGDDKKTFLGKLKDFPEDKRKTLKDLNDRVTEICKDADKTKSDACNPKVFKPTDDSAKEIFSLIGTADPTPDQITKWKGMLAIKKKGETTAYSFNEMQSDLNAAFAKIDSNEIMSKAELKAIKALDDFENNPGLSFVEDIASLKDAKKSKIASDKFFLLMADAKQRQQFEVQSKMSVAWNNVSNIIPGLNDEDKAKCFNAKQSFINAKDCYEKMNTALPKLTGDAKANLSRFLPAIKTAMDYADKLEAKESSCQDEIRKNGTLSESCYADMNKDVATVQDQILQLNMMKEKIGSENVDLMKFRNFALKKWQDQKCQTAVSSMDLCSESTSISKEALMTVSDSMKVAILFVPEPKSQEAAEELCDEDGKKFTKAQERLCEFFDDTTSNIIVKPTEKPAPVDVALTPESDVESTQIRDAWIQGGANLLGQTLGALFPPYYVPPTANLYPQNYYPYNQGTGSCVGIADCTIMNARYNYGYAVYTPTAGYEPFTAFGSTTPSISPYSQNTSFTQSKFFGF